MVVKLKGIIKGKRIELDRELGLPSGSEISLSIETPERSIEERRKSVQSLFGSWKNDADIQQVFKKMTRDRRRRLPRKVDMDAAD